MLKQLGVETSNDPTLCESLEEECRRRRANSQRIHTPQVKDYPQPLSHTREGEGEEASNGKGDWEGKGEE